MREYLARPWKDYILIAGYRRYHKRRRAKRGKSLASWHNFGAAFDLILHERKSMKDALKHMGDDAQRWDRVGEIGRSLGLTWGKPWGVKEIFHFEWHPGALPNTDDNMEAERNQNEAGTTFAAHRHHGT